MWTYDEEELKEDETGEKESYNKNVGLPIVPYKENPLEWWETS